MNNEKIRVIDVLDESGLFAGYLEGTENMSFQMISEQISLEEAKRNISESEDYGLLYIPETETNPESFLNRTRLCVPLTNVTCLFSAGLYRGGKFSARGDHEK